jgi:hypothetical protein
LGNGATQHDKFASVRVFPFRDSSMGACERHTRARDANPVAGYTVVTIMACHVHVSTKLDARLRCGMRRARGPAPIERQLSRSALRAPIERQLSRSTLRANHFDLAEDRKCWQHHDLLVGKRHVLISSVVSLLQLGLTQVAVADQVSSVWLLYKLMMMNE